MTQPTPVPTTPAPAPVAPGNVKATSITAGSPFGFSPDLSSWSPQQIGDFMRGLSNLTYSAPAGGYVFSNEAQNANSYYNKFGAGGGGDPRANAAARSLWGPLGNLPTVPNATAALAALYQNTGLKPTQGPSLNERLATTGLTGPYYGPNEFKGYHPFDKLRTLYGT
jgi:hypothetical protein